MPVPRSEANWRCGGPCAKTFLSLMWFGVLNSCQARDVVVCVTAEIFAYAAQGSLFDFEDHKLRVAWFQAASLTPLPDSGRKPYIE